MEFPTPESVLTRRVLQSLAIALWRVNAAHILQFHRRALFGAQRHDGSDAGVPAAGAQCWPLALRACFSHRIFKTKLNI